MEYTELMRLSMELLKRAGQLENAVKNLFDLNAELKAANSPLVLPDDYFHEVVKDALESCHKGEPLAIQSMNLAVFVR